MVTAGNVTSSRGIVTTTDFTGWVYQAIQTRKKGLFIHVNNFTKFLKELTKDLFSEFQRGIKHRRNENQGPANLAPFCTIGPYNVCQAMDTACTGKMLQVP